MKALAEQINDLDGVNIYGRVVGVRGLMVEVAGPIHAMSVVARIVIEAGGNGAIPPRGVGVRGLMVEVAGPIHAMSVGARIVIETGGNRAIPAEVIGFSGDNAVVMPFGGLDGVRRGCRAVIASAASQVRPSPAWLGRVLNTTGEPTAGKGPPG